MNNNYKYELTKLNGFKQYLTEKKRISEITATDYCKRVMTIAREEEMSLEELTEKIEKICYEYTKGEKVELGKRSHNSFRAALTHYCSFISQNGGSLNANTNKEPSYYFEIEGVRGEGFGIIRLYDKNRKLLAVEVTALTKQLNSNEINRDIAVKCLNMLFNSAYKNDVSSLWSLVEKLNTTATIDGVKLF